MPAGGGVVVGQASDPERGDPGQECPGGVAGVAFDQPYLVDVRERQIRWGGSELDGASGDPGCEHGRPRGGDRGVGPGQGV